MTSNETFNLIRVGRGQSVHLAYGSKAICGANQGRNSRSGARVIDTCTGSDDRATCTKCRSAAGWD